MKCATKPARTFHSFGLIDPHRRSIEKGSHGDFCLVKTSLEPPSRRTRHSSSWVSTHVYGGCSAGESRVERIAWLFSSSKCSLSKQQRRQEFFSYFFRPFLTTSHNPRKTSQPLSTRDATDCTHAGLLPLRSHPGHHHHRHEHHPAAGSHGAPHPRVNLPAARSCLGLHGSLVAIEISVVLEEDTWGRGAGERGMRVFAMKEGGAELFIDHGIISRVLFVPRLVGNTNRRWCFL